MSNYIVSYDLNGSTPTHKQMDDHLETLGASRGRILETVWYVAYSGTTQQLYSHVNSILSSNDRLIVIEAKGAVFRDLLIKDDSLIAHWNNNS